MARGKITRLMPRKNKSRRRYRDESVPKPKIDLHPDTKRGIAVIVLFAIAALLFLSFFDIAGTIGNALDNSMAYLLGVDRFLLPVLLVIIGGGLLFPERTRFGTWNYIGILFFFLSVNALTNLFWLETSTPTNEQLQAAGGLLGQFLGTILPNMAGFWAALVILIALLLVSILLIFNTSLRSLLTVHSHLFGWFSDRLHRRPSVERFAEIAADQEENDELLDEGTPEVEEADELETKKAFRPAMLKGTGVTEVTGEQVLTTRRQRKVSVPMDLLEYRSAKANSGDIERNREMIRRTFEHFNIAVEMSDIAVGPTVTQYALRPAEGVKLSRVVALQNDLALALAAHPIRIEAPIPGKSLVGIEVPNQAVATVALRELLESKAFATRSNNLTIALGKDVTGKTWVTPLDRMPHLLVAGATGSGKSVCLNTIIIALLYENSPDDLRFVMVDPKRVELTAYEGIPHLLVPPITKVDDTVNALKWTVREMERRLDVLSKFGVRDINSYNQKADEKMPRIVVVIDELADLMTASGHEVEAAIVRIAQMARAAGIHLVLATQRPSVDVITGLIKANFPARIAFAVASQTDSRTILDCSGAEKLLGRGDMLFTSAELSKPVRLQGAYVSEAEAARVVEHLKRDGVPDYNYAITKTERGVSIFDGNGDDDPMLEDAAQAVIAAGRASTSLLQRRLKVGYGRAARILDILEERGVVGAPDGSKPREVLVEEWPPAGSGADDREFKERKEMLEVEEGVRRDETSPNDRMANRSVGRGDEREPEVDYLAAQEGDYLDEKQEK